MVHNAVAKKTKGDVMRNLVRCVGLLLVLGGWTAVASAYDNLQVAVYARAQEVSRM